MEAMRPHAPAIFPPDHDGLHLQAVKKKKPSFS